ETLYLPAQPCLPVHLLLVILSTGSWAALTGTCAKLPVMVEDLLGCWSLPFSLCVPVVLWNLDGLGVTLWRPVGSPFRWYRLLSSRFCCCCFGGHPSYHRCQNLACRGDPWSREERGRGQYTAVATEGTRL
uniref:Uncharacterized protein n=1 Tax=Felis catus TaxID=9685 RepID=A0ABI7ZT82_FELCA